jgi:hypothetical protein
MEDTHYERYMPKDLNSKIDYSKINNKVDEVPFREFTIGIKLLEGI